MIFSDIKVGDTVAVTLYAQAYRQQVVKVTPTQFATNSGTVFARADGWQRGGGRYEMRYRAYPLSEPWVAKQLAEKDLAERIDKATKALRTATPDVQAQVFALLGV